jgi:hypothetical protein
MYVPNTIAVDEIKLDGMLPVKRKTQQAAIGLLLSYLNCLSYGLDDRDSRVRFPAGAGNFSLHHGVQNDSGAHPASYPMGKREYFPGGKAVGSRS